MDHYTLETLHIQHVELMIKDLPRSIHFYTNILGLKAIEQKEKSAWLGLHNNTKLIRLIENKDAVKPPQNMTGVYHFAVLLPDRKHLAAFLKHIVDRNHPIVGASDHVFSEAIYLEDPDGIGIEVYADRPVFKWKEDTGEIKVATLPLDTKSLMSAYVKEWEELPEGTTIGHLHFHVSDLEKARYFYCEQLGLNPTMEIDGSMLFVAAAGYHHHIGLNTWNGKNADFPNENTIGLHQVFLQVSKRDQSYLKEIGIVGSEDNEIIDPFRVKYTINSVS